MNESTTKKNDRPALVGYAEWDPKKKRYRIALWNQNEKSEAENEV